MFPERLKDLRKEKRMTQIELATALGVSSGTVAMWETGKRKPSFEMFEKLTQVFDKRIDYILGVPRSDDHHRDGGPFADQAAGLQPVEDGHHDIQDHQVDFLLAAHQLHHLLP